MRTFKTQAAALIACALLSGCVSLPTGVAPMVRHTLVLPDVRPDAAPAASAPTGGDADDTRVVLHVRPLRASGTAAERGLVSLRDDGSVDVDPGHEWFAPPADAVGDALVRALDGVGPFRAAVAAGSRTPAERILEGDLLALHVRDGERAQAVAHVRLMLLDDRGRLLWQREFHGKAALPAASNDAADVATRRAAAMRAALVDLLQQIRAADYS